MKRILSFLLALVLVMGLCCSYASAQDQAPASDEPAAEITSAADEAAVGGTADAAEPDAAAEDLHTEGADEEYFYIDFDYNGGRPDGYGSYVAREYSYGEALGSSLPDVYRDHYLFAGWYTDPTGGTEYTEDTPVTQSLTLYAHWTPRQYTLTFRPCGGTCTTESMVITYGETIDSLPVPTHTNSSFVFVGWYAAGINGSEDTLVDRNTILGEDTVLYAHWKSDQTFVVTFDANGGTCTEQTRYIKYGRMYGDLPEPTRENYYFTGWYTKAEGGNQITLDTVFDSSSSITLYAHWSDTYCPDLPETDFYVYFDAVDGSCDVPYRIVTVGDTFGELPVPTPTWPVMIFEGWYTKEEGGEKVTADSIFTRFGNMILYAHWQEICPDLPETNDYTVDLQDNGEFCMPSSINVVTGRAYGELPVPTRSGYTFVGWFTEEEGGEQVTADDIFTGHSNSILYAHWIRNDAAQTDDDPSGVKYSVDFDYNGGHIDNYASWSWVSEGYSYGEALGSVNPPVCREHYLFVGWFSDPENGQQYTADTPITKDVTLYAHWIPAQYTVTLDANGGTCASESLTVTYGNTLGALPVPTHTNAAFVFDGWYFADGTKADENSVIEQDTTLSAHWAKQSFTVSFDANGGACGTKTKTVKYGDMYGTLPVPTWENYNFTGWFTEAEGGTQITDDSLFSGSSSITLYAHWNDGDCPDLPDMSLYTVFFDANGGSCSVTEKSVHTGTAFGGLPVPTRADYTFEGWYTAAEGGAEITADSIFGGSDNITLYARWSEYCPYLPDGGAYTAFFESDGFFSPARITVTTGDAYGELPVPVRTGYTFDGWFTAKDGGQQVTAEDIFTGNSDITLYGHWSVTEREHTYIGIITTPAACTEDGVMTYTCSGCGDTYTEVIPAAGHKPVTDPARAATATETGLTEGSHCEFCGTVIVSQQIIPALDVRGDISGDGTVNIADALKLFRSVNGQLDAISADMADLNEDGMVNIADALKLFRFVNGQIEAL